MITYIGIIVMFVVIIRSMYSDKVFSDGILKNKEMVGVALLIATVIGGTISLVPYAYIRYSHIGSTIFNRKTHHIEILSVVNDEKTSGSFFLGCGSINQTEYYVYFLQYEDGGIKRDMVRTDSAIIYEKTNETPKIEWTTYDYKIHWLGRFGSEKFDILKDVRKGDYRLIVPQGTVIKKFEIQ